MVGQHEPDERSVRGDPSPRLGADGGQAGVALYRRPLEMLTAARLVLSPLTDRAGYLPSEGRDRRARRARGVFGSVDARAEQTAGAGLTVLLIWAHTRSLDPAIGSGAITGVDVRIGLPRRQPAGSGVLATPVEVTDEHGAPRVTDTYDARKGKWRPQLSAREPRQPPVSETTTLESCDAHEFFSNRSNIESILLEQVLACGMIGTTTNGGGI